MLRRINMRIHHGHIIAIAVAALFLAGLSNAPAADVNISASVDRSTVAPGEEFAFTIRLSGTQQLGNISDPEFPDLDPFEALYGPNRASSIQIINGQMSSTLTFTLGLRGLKEGTFTIPSVVLRLGNKEYKSNPVNVTVTRSAVGNAPASLKEEGIPAPSTDDPDLKKALAGNLFLRIELDNTEPFVGEPVVASYSLYVKEGVPLVNWNPNLPQPAFREFLKEEIFSANRLSFRQIKVGEDLFNVALVRRLILIPTKTGKVVVEPLNLEVGVRVQSRRSRASPFGDPFDDPFFGDPFGRNTRSVRLASPVVEIDVKPAPTPRPEDYNGTVGQYTLTASMDRLLATTDDLLTLSLTLEGEGAIEGAMEPKLPPLEDFEVYETKARTEKKVTEDRIGGKKIFDFVLRPLKPGKKTIPVVTYSIFNPLQKDYVRLETQPIAVDIASGTAHAPLATTGASEATKNGNGVVELNADIHYIRRDAALERTRAVPLALTGAFWALPGVPLLLLLGAFVFRYRRDAIASDQGLARRLRARGQAARRLRAAAKALACQDVAAFYTELATGVRGFLGDKLNREGRGLTAEEMTLLLEEKGVPGAGIQRVRALLDMADAARYAPSSPDKSRMERDYEEARAIIEEFNKSL